MLAAITAAPPLTCSLQSQQLRLLHARCNHSTPACYIITAPRQLHNHSTPPATCSLQSQQPRLLHARCNHSSPASYTLAAITAPRQLHARCNQSSPASYMLAAITAAPPPTCSLQSQQLRLLHARCNSSYGTYTNCNSALLTCMSWAETSVISCRVHYAYLWDKEEEKERCDHKVNSSIVQKSTQI